MRNNYGKPKFIPAKQKPKWKKRPLRFVLIFKVKCKENCFSAHVGKAFVFLTSEFIGAGLVAPVVYFFV